MRHAYISLNLIHLALFDLSIEVLAGIPPPSWNPAYHPIITVSSSFGVLVWFGAPNFQNPVTHLRTGS